MPKDDGGEHVQSINVAVRIRPVLTSDPATAFNNLSFDVEQKAVRVIHNKEKKTAKQFSFDNVLPPTFSQEEVYNTIGVPKLVQAVVHGYHATVFAYGQTGSGKTHTMEGFSYVGSAHQGSAAPRADVHSTPASQFGVTPRAIQQVFDLISQDRDRTYVVKCSFVQIYKEAAYDLLNAGTVAAAPSGGSGQSRGPATSVALRMRWSKRDDFYLENLFHVECSSAADALQMFQTGVQHKVMASHALNAASSRSHALFTLTVTSHPSDRPDELRSSRLTLVDLAGSERAALTGNTTGVLRDESVFINKSLFTLRQVITALANSSKMGPNEPPPHVPYRDSKLTALLKHSLGGEGLALMIACISPIDQYVEESLSTLEYAARTKRITNKVRVNEDPAVVTIRDLRAEIAFLREQLAAATGLAPNTFTFAQPGAVLPVPSISGTQGHQGSKASPAISTTDQRQDGNNEPSTSNRGDEVVEVPSSQADVEALVSKLLDTSNLLARTLTAQTSMRKAYAVKAAEVDKLTAEVCTLTSENTVLRDRLAAYESLVGASAASTAGSVPSMITPMNSALIELEELRRENALLHTRLRQEEIENSLRPLPPSSHGHGVGRPGPSGSGPSRSSTSTLPLSNPFIPRDLATSLASPPTHSGPKALNRSGSGAKRPSGTTPPLPTDHGKLKGTGQPRSAPTPTRGGPDQGTGARNSLQSRGGSGGKPPGVNTGGGHARNKMPSTTGQLSVGELRALLGQAERTRSRSSESEGDARFPTQHQPLSTPSSPPDFATASSQPLTPSYSAPLSTTALQAPGGLSSPPTPLLMRTNTPLIPPSPALSQVRSYGATAEDHSPEGFSTRKVRSSGASSHESGHVDEVEDTRGKLLQLMSSRNALARSHIT